MSKNKFIPVVVIVIFVSSYIFIVSTTFAFDTNAITTVKKDISSQEQNNSLKNKREAKIANYNAIQNSIDNNDYNTWKMLIAENPTATNEKILSIVNEDNFYKYVEYIKLTRSGKYSEANLIKRELGLNFNKK